MKFEELHRTIPYVLKTPAHKLHSVKTLIAAGDEWRVQTGSPGKYWHKSMPLGGDFVVEVTDSNVKWRLKKFRHDHLFEDLALKTQDSRHFMQTEFAPALARVIRNGDDPADEQWLASPFSGVHLDALLYASQALALAEHRRYKQFESSGGGRFLPARFAMGIIFGQWGPASAAAVMYKGKPGLEMLVKEYGEPPKLAELIKW